MSRRNGRGPRRADLEPWDLVEFIGEPHFAAVGDKAILVEKTRGMWKVRLTYTIESTVNRPRPDEFSFDTESHEEYWFEHEFSRTDEDPNDAAWRRLLPDTSFSFRRKLERSRRRRLA